MPTFSVRGYPAHGTTSSSRMRKATPVVNAFLATRRQRIPKAGNGGSCYRAVGGGNQHHILALGNGRAAWKFADVGVANVLQILDADLAGIEAVAG